MEVVCPNAGVSPSALSFCEASRELTSPINSRMIGQVFCKVF